MMIKECNQLVTEKEEIKCTNLINRYKNYEIW